MQISDLSDWDLEYLTIINQIINEEGSKQMKANQKKTLKTSYCVGSDHFVFSLCSPPRQKFNKKY